MTSPVFRRVPTSHPSRRQLVAWLAVLALVWLDAHGPHAGRHLAVFSFVWSALGFLWDALGVVGGAVATSLEAVVTYLAQAVAWLTTRVGHIMLSTGAIFARAWEALRTLWSRVLRPALVWLDEKLRALENWLRETFEPIVQFIQRVRDEILALYRRFVQPILDIIGFVRQLNRVLVAFHIRLLEKLDQVLGDVENRLTEPILWLNDRLNWLAGWINLIIGADGLFLRTTLLRSLWRDLNASYRMGFWARTYKLSQSEIDALTAANAPPTPGKIYREFRRFLEHNEGPTAARVTKASASMRRRVEEARQEL